MSDVETAQRDCASRPAAGTAPPPLRVDFVSDVTCPWCAIGLQALEQAMARLAATVSVDLHLQPFELNPGLPVEGIPIGEYAARKYGSSPGEVAARQALIRQRGAEVGLALVERTAVYNTFDAHRLLHWSALQGRALALKRALLQAYHVRGENPALHDVLLRAAGVAGLDPVEAAAILARGDFADEVQEAVRHWRQLGIRSVPSVVIDRRRVVEGAQSAAVFEQLLQRR